MLSEKAKIKMFDNFKYWWEWGEIESFCAPGGTENCQLSLNCNLSISSKVKTEQNL